MKSSKLAHKIWKDFSCKEGSQFIATETAISGLVKWLKYAKPTTILEIGSGIGTLTYTIIHTMENDLPQVPYKLVCVEDNEFCLRQLKQNLGLHYDKIKVVSKVQKASEETFDFIITDGGPKDDPSLFHKLSDRGIVFIEGVRRPQAKILETIIGSQPYVKANKRTLKLKEKSSKGIRWEIGYRLYKLNPDFYDRILFTYLDFETRIIWRVRTTILEPILRKA